jgi:penicillin-binding protein 1B
VPALRYCPLLGLCVPASGPGNSKVTSVDPVRCVDRRGPRTSERQIRDPDPTPLAPARLPLYYESDPMQLDDDRPAMPPHSAGLENKPPAWRARASRWRRAVSDRLYDVVTDPRVRLGGALLLAVMVGSFAVLWVRASNLVDEYLAGGLASTRSGVFAAPLTVRVGQPLGRDDLVAYLQQLGYGSGEGEGNDQARGFSGHFAVDGDTVVIEPLDETIVASGQYPSVEIHFSGSEGVAKIVDRRTKRAVKECLLEPLLISSTHERREKRIEVGFDAIPPTLRNAIVTVEDRRFWSHRGVDYRGIARAARENWRAGEISEGGSTITQQLVKNLILSPERTFTRKLNEAMLSYVFEWKLSKEEIFALYCNEVYLGQSGTYAVHGFAEASRRFFGKDLSALTLDEAALLAGLIRSPNSVSPYKRPEKAKARRDLVLDLMAEAQVVSAEEAAAAKAAPVQVQPLSYETAWLDAPYFTDYVESYLEDVFDESAPALGRVTIQTTLDINLQHAATEALRAHLEKLDAVFARGKNATPPGTLQAALVAVEPRSGAVVAMVGGRNYAASQLNRATVALRQPGSVFKPFVYATAIDTRRYTPASMIMDAPQVFSYGGGETYTPGNYGDAYANKEISIRSAFRQSKNVPTVEVALRTGLDRIAVMAERAGLPKPATYPSMALGVAEATPLQLAEAYTTFANQGSAVEPTPIAAVVGRKAFSSARTASRPVFSPQVAYVMTSLMEDVVNRGTGAKVRARGLRGAVAGKTGTSRDGWFAGYTPGLVCIVWVGFDDNSQLGLTGAEAALPIWTDFMKKAVAFRPDLGGESFPRPSGISTAKVCAESGGLASELCPSTYDEIFLSGSEAYFSCPLHVPGMELPPLYDEYGNPIDPAAIPEMTTEEPEEPRDPDELPESPRISPDTIVPPPADEMGQPPQEDPDDASNRPRPRKSGPKNAPEDPPMMVPPAPPPPDD